MLTTSNYKKVLPQEYHEFIRLIELERADNLAEFMNSHGDNEYDEATKLVETLRITEAMPTSSNVIINQHMIINCISIAILNKHQDALDAILSNPYLDFSGYMGNENPIVQAFDNYQRDSMFDSLKIILALLAKKLSVIPSRLNTSHCRETDLIHLIEMISTYNSGADNIARLIAEDKIADLANTISIYGKALSRQWVDKLNLHVLHESIDHNFLHKLINSPVYYKIVRKSINNLTKFNSNVIVEPKILFDATVTLARAHLIRAQSATIGFDMAVHYFIIASEIATHAQLKITDGQKIFFTILEQFHGNDEVRLSDPQFTLLEFILSLKTSLAAGSQEALTLLECISHDENRLFLSVAASYILEINDYASIQSKAILSVNWSALEALKLFYGLGAPIDLDDSFYQFNRTANKKNKSNPNAAMLAHLYCIRILREKISINLAEQGQNKTLQESKSDEVLTEQQLQDMETANLIQASALSNIFQNSFANFKAILELNVAFSPETLITEIFKTIFEFSNLLKSYKDKVEMLNIAIEYFKITSETILHSAGHEQWKSDFLKSILTHIRESGLLTKVTSWNGYITNLGRISKSISNRDYITIILNEFELLANHAKELYDNDELQYFIHNELIILQKHHLPSLTVQQLHHAIANLDELVRLDNNLAILGQNKAFNLRKYRTIYTAMGNSESVANKLKYYSKAVNLGDAVAILGIIDLADNHNIIIENIASLASTALAHAIFPENESVIAACYNISINLQLTAALMLPQEMPQHIQNYFHFAEQAKRCVNSTHSKEMLGILINENYFPAQVKLMRLLINQNNVPESLYLSALVVSELTLRNSELEVRYGLSDQANQKLKLECFNHIGKYTNSKTEKNYNLAKWYMGYLAYVTKLKTTRPDLHTDANASILCNAESSKVLVIADLVKASMIHTRFYAEEDFEECRKRHFDNSEQAIVYVSDEDKMQIIADASTKSGAELPELPRSLSWVNARSTLWNNNTTNSLPLTVSNRQLRFNMRGGVDAD